MEIFGKLSTKVYKVSITISFFNDTTGKDWCFTQFSIGMSIWLVMIFLIYLHNQLSSIHPIISTDV